MSIRKISLTAPGQLSMSEGVQIPMEDGMVRLNVHACAICGSDLSLIAGHRDLSKERYFGHEFSGVVTEVSGGSIGFSVGDRAATELARTCGRCWNCRNGLENYCKSMNEALVPGGFTEDTLVASREDYGFLSAVPDTVDDVTAALLEPTSCAYRIAMQASLKPGDNVLIYGVGAMGLISGMILKKLGAGKIVVAGRRPARLNQVKETGIFDDAVTNDEEGKKKMLEIFGADGADIVIEATGAAPVLVSAMEMARRGGRIVAGSVYSSCIPNFDPLPIFRKELTLIGAKGPYVYRNSDGSSAVVTMLEKIQDDLRKIVKVYDYKDAMQAFEDARSGEAIKAVIRFR